MPPRDEIRRDLTRMALVVGGLLNVIQDDDEREQLQAHYERVLNDELWAGSQNRRLAAPLHHALQAAGLRPVNNVVELHSVRVDKEAS